MKNIEKGCYIGIGVLLGLLAFKSFNFINIGNVNELTVYHLNDDVVHEEK